MEMQMHFEEITQTRSMWYTCWNGFLSGCLAKACMSADAASSTSWWCSAGQVRCNRPGIVPSKVARGLRDAALIWFSRSRKFDHAHIFQWEPISCVSKKTWLSVANNSYRCCKREWTGTGCIDPYFMWYANIRVIVVTFKRMARAIWDADLLINVALKQGYVGLHSKRIKITNKLTTVN